MTSLGQQNPHTPVKSSLHQQQLSLLKHNKSQNVQQHHSSHQSEDSNSVHNSHQSESRQQSIEEEQSLSNNQKNEASQIRQPQQNQSPTPQGDAQNFNKPQSTCQKQTQRKRRRKKLDADGRDYTCSCGKSYLSYPALYTHVKTKHNGQISITQNLRIPLAPSNPMTQSRDNLHSYKKQSSPNAATVKPQPDDDHLAIDKIKQFIYRQFIKERPKDALMEFRNSLKLKEEEKMWMSYVMKLVEDGEAVKVEEGREGAGFKMMGSGSKSENLIVDGGCFGGSNSNGYREDNGEGFSGFGGSPQMKKFQRIHVIRTVMMDKNLKQNNKLMNNSSRKGLVSCIFPSVPQNSRKPSNKPQDTPIDQVLGTFLSEFLKGVASNELITTAVVYFVSRIKDYCERQTKKINTSEKPAQLLIEESSELVAYLIEMENTYLKQPIVVCKLLFFFYRWMFKQQYTNRFVRFNQAG